MGARTHLLDIRLWASRARIKAGLIAGMSMTEKARRFRCQNQLDNCHTNPRRIRCVHPDGHKWFCSAPMSDIFLVLGQTEGGLTCFVVPRVPLTEPATSSASSVSRTNSGIDPTHRARSNSRIHGPSDSAMRVAESRPLSRWCPRRASIVSSAQPHSCARHCPRPFGMRNIGPRSANNSSTNPDAPGTRGSRPRGGSSYLAVYAIGRRHRSRDRRGSNR